MEPIAVAFIGAIGGLASGIVVSVVGPLVNDKLSRDREDRDQRRQLYEELTAALETWMAVVPLVAYNSSKAEDQLRAQEKVRALGPRLDDPEAVRALQALVDGGPADFQRLHAEAVAALAEAARDG